MGGKLFLKTLYSSLILLFLAVNILIFFDLLYLVPNAAQVPQNSYFGFRSFLDIFEYYQNNSFLTDFTSYISGLSNDLRRLLYGNWVAFSEGGGVYDLESFFYAIGYFFASIGGALGMIYYALVLLVYLIACFGFFISSFFYVMGGNFYSIVPLSPYPELVSLMLIPSF